MNNTSLNNIQAINEVAIAKGKSNKANIKTTASNEFDKFFKKASVENKNVLQNNKNINEENLKEKDIKLENNSDLKKADDKALKDNGVSEESNIEDEIEKLKDSKSKEDYINNLINLLEKMLNGEVDGNLNLLQELSKEFNGEMFNQLLASTDSESINKIKNDILEIMKNNLNGSLKELENKPLSEILNFVVQLPSMNTSEKSDFKAQIIKVLKDKLESLNTKDEFSDVNENLSNNTKNNKFDFNLNKMNDKTSAESFEQNNSEEELLRKLAFSDKDDEIPKFQKAINYMGRINEAQEINPVVEVDSKNFGMVNSKNLVEDLVKDVKFMQLNNLKEMTVKINPKDLGQLFIRVTMENGIMKANITAQNKDAYNLLNTNYNELNSKLSDGGIKIQNVTIDIYNGDTTFFSDEKSRHENQQGFNKGNKSNITVNEEETSSLETSNTIDNSSVNAFV